MDRPYVLVNAAMSIYGKIDSLLRDGAVISSSLDSARVDSLRAECDAVMVGGRTLQQDPRLTVKSAELRQERLARGLPENPAKVGVISVADIPLDGRFMSVEPARRLIYTTARTTPQQVVSVEKFDEEGGILLHYKE